MSELLPCPFCGGPAQFGLVPFHPDEEEQEPNAGGRYVECTKCQASTCLVFPLKDDVDRELAERWNRRANALTSRVAALEQIVREVYALSVDKNGDDIFPPALMNKMSAAIAIAIDASTKGSTT